MPELTENALNIAAIACLSLGAVLCFLGYRVFLLLLALGGFVAIGLAAAVGGLLVSQDVTIAIIAGVLGGFIGAVLMVLLYYAVLFNAGAVTAGVIGYFLCAYSGTPFTTVTMAAILGAAVLGGILALFLQRFVIVVSSSIQGAGMITIGIFYFIRRATLNPLLIGLYAALSRQIGEVGLNVAIRDGLQVPPEFVDGAGRLFNTPSLYLMGLGAIALTLLGIAVQYTVTARPKKPIQPPAKPNE